MRIDYPVVIDNDYAIWRAFKNQYWPALYFLDARGRIREHHFGEGEYSSPRRSFNSCWPKRRCRRRRRVVSVDASGVEAAADWANLRSPENYVGYARTQNFASPAAPNRIDAASMPRLRDWR